MRGTSKNFSICRVIITIKIHRLLITHEGFRHWEYMLDWEDKRLFPIGTAVVSAGSNSNNTTFGLSSRRITILRYLAVSLLTHNHHMLIMITIQKRKKHVFALQDVWQLTTSLGCPASQQRKRCPHIYLMRNILHLFLTIKVQVPVLVLSSHSLWQNYHIIVPFNRKQSKPFVTVHRKS